MIFELSVTGVQDAERHLRGLGHGARHARRAFEEIADTLIDLERSKWRRNRWMLADSTLERKHRQGLDLTPLVSSGLLQRTVTARDPSAKAHGLLLDIGDEHAIFGIKGGRTDIFYGRILQKGARNRRRGGRLPPRAVIPATLSPKVRKEMHGIMLRHLVRAGRAPLSVLD